MSTWLLTGGTLGGLIGLIAAAALVWFAQVDVKHSRPYWLLPGLSLVAFSGMILYGGSLLGSLYIQVTHLVSVMSLP